VDNVCVRTLSFDGVAATLFIPCFANALSLEESRKRDTDFISAFGLLYSASDSLNFIRPFAMDATSHRR